jgi:glycosyltransferase involved in cell wall biosynthesis
LLQALAMRLYKAAFRRSHRVFFQNRDDLDLVLRKRIVTPAQAALVPGSGIDLGRYQIAPVPVADPPVFLFIGRLLRDKGIREFAEAARLVRQDVPDAAFRVVGGLDPDNRTSVTAAELEQWGETIEYLGPTEDVRPFIADSTAVVLPSYREGLPRTLLEGAAMGRPLVATDVPGCREIVREGVTGTLGKPRDSRSLADAMLRLARLNPAERARLGANARELVEERYSERVVIRAYLEALSAAGLPAKQRQDVRI